MCWRNLAHLFFRSTQVSPAVQGPGQHHPPGRGVSSFAETSSRWAESFLGLFQPLQDLEQHIVLIYEVHEDCLDFSLGLGVELIIGLGACVGVALLKIL